MDAVAEEATEARLLKQAKEIVDKKTKDSVVFDANAENRIPKFDPKGTARQKKRDFIGMAASSNHVPTEAWKEEQICFFVCV